MKAFVSGYKTMWSKGLLSIYIAYIVSFSIIYLKLKKYKDRDFLFFLPDFYSPFQKIFEKINLNLIYFIL